MRRPKSGGVPTAKIRFYNHRQESSLRNHAYSLGLASPPREVCQDASGRGSEGSGLPPNCCCDGTAQSTVSSADIWGCVSARCRAGSAARWGSFRVRIKPRLGLLQRKGILVVKNAGTHPAALGQVHDVKTAVTLSMSCLVQTKALALCDPIEVLFLCVSRVGNSC